jgi:iron complex outermembrane recepter protein
MRILAILLVSSLLVAAQEPRREVVVVTGTYEPIPLEEAERAITVLPVGRQALVAASLIDFLKLDPALDVRQRAPGGVQADVSIRGGTFAQTLVLIDGQRLNDAQTGHHNLDIPIPLEAVDRVEVLRGAGSALYGADAVGGVVNLVTAPVRASEMRLRTAIGNYGVNQQRGSLAGVAGEFTGQLNFSRDFSSGFAPDRDYRNLGASAMGHWRGTSLMLGAADKPFGASGFYGNYDSWERTKTWFAAIKQELDKRTSASFVFRRHTDLFVLTRERPEVYTNRHAVESYQGTLRRREELGGNVRLHYGAEVLTDSIDSSNLGRHARTREAGYVSMDARALGRYSFTAALRDEVSGSLHHELCPTLGGGVWMNQHAKIRASASRAFRMPTYTELYYHDPANLGSPALLPESAWSYDAGLDWNTSSRVNGEATIFHRRERDAIDYLRNSPTAIWRATNFDRLRFTGVETTIRISAGRGGQLDLRYTALRGNREIPLGVETKYVFNYPSHAGVAAWQGTWKGFLARTRVGALARVNRSPYGLWDLYATRLAGAWHPFFQIANITSTRYEEIAGVVMPGRSLVLGFEYVLRKR